MAALLAERSICDRNRGAHQRRSAVVRREKNLARTAQGATSTSFCWLRGKFCAAFGIGGRISSIEIIDRTKCDRLRLRKPRAFAERMRSMVMFSSALRLSASASRDDLRQIDIPCSNASRSLKRAAVVSSRRRLQSVNRKRWNDSLAAATKPPMPTIRVAYVERDIRNSVILVAHPTKARATSRPAIGRRVKRLERTTDHIADKPLHSPAGRVLGNTLPSRNIVMRSSICTRSGDE